MLTYNYNYQRNFDGISFQTDPQKITDLDKLHAKFESQKTHDVITNLFEQWKLDNPDFVNHPKIKTFKQIVMMLSNYILSYLSINKGLDDDYKILLPYYFELKSKPTRISIDKIWVFENVYVSLKSEYFDFTDLNNIKIKNKNRTSPHMYLWRE